MEDTHKIAAIQKWLGTGSINIFGRQFAGKDTHGRELAELFNGVLLNGGDILRNSAIPAHVKASMNAGKLVPINDFIEIVVPFLSNEILRDNSLILSAVGRWHGEEEGVIQAVETAGHTLKAVIYIEIDEPTAYARWEHTTTTTSERDHRNDETKKSLDKRLEEFRNKTLPVIDYYEEKGLLITVDGTLEKRVVFEQILDALYEFSQR